MLKSNGDPRQFSTGAVRDSDEGKPPLELLPMDLLARVAFHYGLGGGEIWKR